MQQVFWNLLSNAQKFTSRDGTITIRSRNTDDGGIEVQVSDTGVGIEPDLLPRLFNAFEQGNATAATRRKGLGLGLAISKALVVAHGGTLVALSEGRGRGSTFTVRLPTVAARQTAQPGSDNGKRLGPPRRILLVEDDAPTLLVLRRLLEERQHQVTAATNVESALRAAEGSAFDLVISDLGLPDGSGDELMRELKTRFGLRGIALSGYGMEGDVRRSLDAGFSEHLTKPLDMNSLETAMTRVLEEATPAT
jgi:CheY-like chemotaxis protein